MAKAAAPKVPISTRVSPDLAREIEALVAATGKSKSDVAEGLLRAGLDATKPGRATSDSNGEMLAQVLAAVAGLKPTGADNGEVLEAIADLGSGLAGSYDEVNRRQEKFAEAVAADAEKVRAEVVALKRALGITLCEMLRRLHPGTSEEEVKQRVRKAFES